MHPVEEYQDIINLTVDKLNECEILTPTRKRLTLNYYITQCTGNSISWTQDAVEKTSTQQSGPSGLWLSSCSWGSDELERRCWIEEHFLERLGPQASDWAAQENGKETQLWPIEWGSICCSSVRSPTLSHTQPFQIKWEVYFSKRLCRSSLLCRCVLHEICIMWLYNIALWFFKPFNTVPIKLFLLYSKI